MRTTAGSALAAIQIGGWGFCTGRIVQVASWTRKNGSAITAVTAAFGRNDTDHGARNAMFVEGSRHLDMNTFYGRFEVGWPLAVLNQLSEIMQHALGPVAQVANSRVAAA